VKEFLDTAFSYLDLDYRKHLVVDQDLYRPSEVNILQGDATKAHQKLKWYSESAFEGLVQEMVDGDIEWYTKSPFQS
jgi:GDPmannose 4,6-dehydratase